MSQGWKRSSAGCEGMDDAACHPGAVAGRGQSGSVRGDRRPPQFAAAGCVHVWYNGAGGEDKRAAPRGGDRGRSNEPPAVHLLGTHGLGREVLAAARRQLGHSRNAESAPTPFSHLRIGSRIHKGTGLDRWVGTVKAPSNAARVPKRRHDEFLSCRSDLHERAPAVVGSMAAVGGLPTYASAMETAGGLSCSGLSCETRVVPTPALDGAAHDRTSSRSIGRTPGCARWRFVTAAEEHGPGPFVKCYATVPGSTSSVGDGEFRHRRTRGWYPHPDNQRVAGPTSCWRSEKFERLGRRFNMNTAVTNPRALTQDHPDEAFVPSGRRCEKPLTMIQRLCSPREPHRDSAVARLSRGVSSLAKRPSGLQLRG